MNALFWCFIICLTRRFSVQATSTACRVPSARETGGANLTCYFPEDVNQSKKNFAVLHYNGKDRPNPVLDCLWVSGHLECTTADGYAFDKVVSATATLVIARVTAKETGKYSCQITGSQPKDLRKCELSLSTGKSTCEIRVDKETTPQTNLICRFPEDVRQSQKSVTVYRYNHSGDPAVVADCLWYLGGLQCSTQPGFQLDTSLSDSFVVRLPETSAGLSESYMCRVSGSLHEDASMCVRRTAERENSLQCPPETSSTLYAVMAVVVLIAVAVVLVFEGHKVLRRLQVCCKDQRVRENPEDVESCRNSRNIASNGYHCRQTSDSIHIKPQSEQMESLVSMAPDGKLAVHTRAC